MGSDIFDSLFIAKHVKLKKLFIDGQSHYISLTLDNCSSLSKKIKTPLIITKFFVHTRIYTLSSVP